MEILPAWLIEELEKMEELKRQQERPRVYAEPPINKLPPVQKNDLDVVDEPIVISMT